MTKKLDIRLINMLINANHDKKHIFPGANQGYFFTSYLGLYLKWLL